MEKIWKESQQVVFRDQRKSYRNDVARPVIIGRKSMKVLT